MGNIEKGQDGVDAVEGSLQAERTAEATAGRQEGTDHQVEEQELCSNASWNQTC